MTNGTITDLTLTNAAGKVVAGTLNADSTAWTLGEELGYGKSYTVAGHAVNSAGVRNPISGTYATVAPDDTVRTIITPGDGEVVGVAAPVEIRFAVEPADRDAIEKAVSISTTPAVEGAWAWIKHDDGRWALDYRPKDYWPSGTTVHVDADVYGVDFGAGEWGREDLTSDFTIGRNQVVLADVNSHDLVVQRDGVTVATYPASYGKGTNADLTTRSGIHVVNELFETKLMSNPKYGYVDELEHWAVRISNNGEFIHANPNSVEAQGNSNVSHGCVNLSPANAEEYFRSALYGDPVEVTGTDVTLSAEDGDIYDWAVPWQKWVSLSDKNT
ncbi:MAG: Ig-like domain-containing protein [Nakamurella sp.]